MTSIIVSRSGGTAAYKAKRKQMSCLTKAPPLVGALHHKKHAAAANTPQRANTDQHHAAGDNRHPRHAVPLLVKFLVRHI